jgi:hypothetical protein
MGRRGIRRKSYSENVKGGVHLRYPCIYGRRILGIILTKCYAGEGGTGFNSLVTGVVRGSCECSNVCCSSTN